MSSIDVNNASAADGTQGDQDLGPLAWVLDELRKSLDAAVKAMRRFVRDAEVARESDLAALDAGPLRIARQQLHQACGALEMVGMGPPALVLRSMESAVQKFVQRPETCSDDAAAVIERASFALIEYLETVLAGKAVSPVALFPQYRDAQALAGADRVHPADLWPVERRFREPEGAVSRPPLSYGPEARARLDAAVLRIVKSGDLKAALSLRDTCLGFVAAQTDRQARAFWKICAGFFDAFGSGLLPPDVYVKRVASRVLMQYATLAKGDPTIADRLVQDLLFFCSQARVADLAEDAAPSLRAVRQAFALDRFKPVDYETARFGRFDPAVLTQARKRIASATETWSALAGGDRNKLKPAADQFSLVCDSLRKLHPGSENLAQALTRALDSTTRSGEPPSPALAMEVATSVLYLQAAFEELDAADDQMEARASRLAERLDAVTAGAEPEPLEQWMEELYRRVSDNQTMGSVVDELRVTLGEAEKAMDQFFRSPKDTGVLATVPGHLAQMRGVLSVLGLDQASLAVVRMRDTVERLLINEMPEEERQSAFEKLGNSLGALGFLIDMLSYQRTMARKLFVYDEDLGELRILMGKTRARASDAMEEAPAKLEERSATVVPDVIPRFPVQEPVSEPTDFAPFPDFESAPAAEPAGLAPDISFDVPAPVVAAPAPAPAEASSLVAAAAPAAVPDVEDELLDVFLEEAREVVVNGLAAIDQLRGEPGDLSEQTTLRRAFHTLKGSSRMVGLNDFGEAAWSMEQVLNVWLAEQKPMQPSLLQLSTDALHAFSRWADDIAAGRATGWDPESFRRSADAMRMDGTLVPLVVPSDGRVSPEPAAPQVEPEIAETALEPVAALAAEVPHDELTVPDFQATEISMRGSDQPAEAVAAAPEAAEEIDFSVFTAALNESAHEPAPVVDPSSADFVLDLELPDMEPVAGATPAQEIAHADPVDVPLEAPADAMDEALLLPEELVLDAGELKDVVSADAPANVPSDGLEALDVAELEKLLEAESAEAAELLAPVAEVAASSEALPQDIGADVEPAPEVPNLLDALPQEEGGSDDAVKVIDTLRIGIPLYNVYLNEADEWSRRLVTCLQEWALELHEPLPDVAVALSHSLAGSSATVGFTALSEMARMLEHTLQHVQLQSGGTQEQAAAFMAAAEDIRRLLHQFAAGFLKEPSPEVLAQLRQILETEVVSTQSPPEEDAQAYLDAAEQVASQAPEAGLLTVDAEPEAEPAVPAAPVPVAGHVAPALSAVVHDHDQRIDDAIAHAIASIPDADDDIDAIDVIDPDLFPIFEEEAAELLPQLGGALRQWASRPDNLSARSEVLRALHTLKGSSRLAGAMRLGEMAHRLESAIEQLDVETVTTDQIEPLQGSFDGLQANFDALRAIGQNPSDTVVALPVETVPASRANVADAVEPSVSQPAAPSVRPQAITAPAVRLPGPSQLAPLRVAANQSVRVRAQLLDRLVNQAGEVMISRSRLDARLGQFRSSLVDLSGNLDRLRQQLRDIEVQAESQMQSRLALSKDSAAGFDPLEFDRFTRVQELTRMMAESVNDVATVQRNLQRAMEGAEDDLIAQGRQARELQRDLLRTRMVEFEGIAERLYAVVRQASKETGKQIKLDITGGSIEMDRGVLDRMTPAFEHLLRNCVAHGIEEPEVRTAAGKPASGTITVDLHHEGNDVSVEFRDDGAGLNLPRIREKALSQGIVEPGVELSDADAANLIFMPGFSTASEVTGLAGRGIGMDVVRAEINALGGRIETSTEAGKGAAFRMVLPLTTAVTQVVMLRSGDLAIGVPANVVEIVRRTSAPDLAEAYRTGVFDDGMEKIPFFWSGALLQSSARSTEPAGKTRPVVIFRSAAQRIAMHVDEVLGNQEVVVKNLGPQLSRLPGLAGMSVLASGAVVLIYNPVALATVYGDQVRAASADMAPAPDAQGVAGTAKAVVSPQLAGTSQVPLVLVVDDSITVRRVTQRLLQREGYRVALAADGLQALERLQEERPTVVLSDIEMPRMDGFDLARNIRADGALRDLPIIMITSRIAEKHREHAMELGVNHYLGKPYSDEELLSLIQHYARVAAAAEA
ncbi:chemosensory pili system protein ChpA (sensor histidine kinase/response regulator) [Acidovorax sp. 107]|uniref:hybrid sensor histidine kinase/response regulator n=1 Tax=Acidovorax sp. 107 TaxID=2135638 RepID=UPI000D3C3788|nr:Hpt domain-containing protein [Acidovorax sp. 107]PUA95427.1 chemosensory pili system protein ChpA (sensor histidine kinase/response regulator) [Acidovorax sp. 107]